MIDGTAVTDHTGCSAPLSSVVMRGGVSMATTTSVFVCYPQGGTSLHAIFLFGQLFTARSINVFMDKEDIKPGSDFPGNLVQRSRPGLHSNHVIHVCADVKMQRCAAPTSYDTTEATPSACPHGLRRGGFSGLGRRDLGCGR